MFAEINGSRLVTFPYDYDTLQRKNPNTAFDTSQSFFEMYAGTEESLSGNSLVVVIEQPCPSYDRKNQTPVLNKQPSLVDGQWVLGWTIATMDQAQQAQAFAQEASSVRNQRNAKLSECDWTQLSDSSVNKQAWAAYRQALRDISKQPGFPWTIDWPVAP